MTDDPIRGDDPSKTHARPAPAVRPGSGWPGDPAAADTPVARSAADVRALAESAGSLTELAARESVCRACPRLVRWREDVARTKRRSFQSETYWGRPVPGWGADRPSILILGLAPAAHGGNRTGRIFTGDRSGDFLFASLWRCGLATQPYSVAAGDGQRLISVRMAATVRCAPPDNKPTPAERDACAPWLTADLTLVRDDVRVVVCLGHFAWQALWPQLAATGYDPPRPRPPFGHGAEVVVPAAGSCIPGKRPPGAPREVGIPGERPPGAPRKVGIPGERPPGAPRKAGGPAVTVLGCYHPSQQNTFTGRITEPMLDAVFGRARDLAGR